MEPKRDWLITAREEKKISRAELANIVGVNFTYIEKIENGTRTPRYTVAVKIGRALGIPENETLLNFYSGKTA